MNQSKPLSWNSNQENSQTKSNTYKKTGFFQKVKNAFSVKTFLALIVILQIVIVALILNPLKLYQDYQNQQVLSEVGALTTLNKSETPVIAQVSDAEALRKENAIQAQVYKDAKNGDYVIGYTDKLIIYRKEEGKLIYNGDTPSAVLTKSQQDIIDGIIEKTKEKNLISQDSTEQPQVSIVSDISKLKGQNPTFYANARNNDVVAIFSDSQVIVLYNLETKTIINSGKFVTSIK